MKTGFLVILTTKTWSPSLWRPFFCGEVLHALHYVKSKPSYKCLISAISRKKSQRGKPQCTGSLSSALSAGSWTLQTIPSSPGALGCTSIMSKNWMSFLFKVFSKKISHFLRAVGMVQLHHCKCSRFQEVSSSTIVNEICRSPVTHTLTPTFRWDGNLHGQRELWAVPILPVTEDWKSLLHLVIR